MVRVLVICLFLSSSFFAEELTIDTKAITKVHNDLRAQYKLRGLKYSKTLEKSAQKWAKKLQKDGCGMVHSHGKVGAYGENLYWASPMVRTTTRSDGKVSKESTLQKVKDEAVVQAWFDEVKWYDYSTNSCEEGQMCGHYTQVIWNTTRELGCAAMACSDRSQVWVCEYAPAGNIVMQYANGSTKKLKPY